ncbi:dehydrogenase/reductase SDR family member 7B-like [Ochotona princeps]|uniref:dehydrogenase/reductase SDR family member 7B-like n=1 Tax=Ochotona princeps TaxID=9978 RepID=UPI0027147E6D|nr:dehydrogenase/reductase SDR family member 7B-like [Ochotona princeps]
MCFLGRTSTGASSGIGLSLVRHLAIRGCYLILSSRKEEDLKAARENAIVSARAAGLNRSEKDFLIIPFDMKEREVFMDVVETARKWKGRIDFLFSNAGVACRGIMLPSAIDQEILDVNLCSQMHFVKLVVALMMQQHKGQAIITNSMSARISLGGRTAYSAAKAGLLNFAYGLSRELRGMHSPVVITSVLPGYIKTNLCDRELYADNLSLSKGAHMAEDIQKGLSADRTAELILRGSSRRLREVWVGKNPDLFYMYCMYYVPNIANRVVDQGAGAYLRSIEHEIRERHYAQRRATLLAEKEKGKEETQALLPPVTDGPTDSAFEFESHPGLLKEKDDGASLADRLLPGEAGAGLLRRYSRHLFPLALQMSLALQPRL